MKKDTRVRLGARLKHFRSQSALTQARLGEKAGLSQNFIGYVEQGTKIPSIETLEQICRALDISLRKFFAVFK